MNTKWIETLIYFKNVTCASVRRTDKKCDSINLIYSIIQNLKKIVLLKIFLYYTMRIFICSCVDICYYSISWKYLPRRSTINSFSFLFVLKFKLFFLLYAFFEAYYGRISWCSRFFCISLIHIWIFHSFVIIGLFVEIFFHSVFDDKRLYIFIFHLLHLIYPVIENISSYL